MTPRRNKGLCAIKKFIIIEKKVFWVVIHFNPAKTRTPSLLEDSFRFTWTNKIIQKWGCQTAPQASQTCSLPSQTRRKRGQVAGLTRGANAAFECRRRNLLLNLLTWSNLLSKLKIYHHLFPSGVNLIDCLRRGKHQSLATSCEQGIDATATRRHQKVIHSSFSSLEQAELERVLTS